jgi:hypothetical protein
MTSDWAADLIKKKKAKLADENANRDKELSDRKLLAAAGPQMWSDLRQAMCDCIDALNHGMGDTFIEILQSNETAFSVKVDVNHYLWAFSPDLWLFHAGSKYRLIPIQGNGIVWNEEQTKRPFTKEQIAQREIGKIFGK